jgi:hypothetical protein
MQTSENGQSGGEDEVLCCVLVGYYSELYAELSDFFSPPYTELYMVVAGRRQEMV